MENTQIDRVYERLRQIGMTEAEFARALGTVQQTVNNWKRRGRVPANRQPDVARILRCSIDWLATGNEGRVGEGYAEYGVAEDRAEYLASEKQRVAVPAYEIRQWEDEDDLDENGDVTIPVYDVQLSAGGGSVVPEFVETKRRLAFSRHWLQRKRANPNHLRVLPVRGDSMMPTLHDRDCVLIDLNDTRVVDGKIYALVIGGEAKVKRLRKRWDGGLIVMSDNPAPEYPDEEVPAEGLDHIYIIGRAIQRSGEL